MTVGELKNLLAGYDDGQHVQIVVRTGEEVQDATAFGVAVKTVQVSHLALQEVSPEKKRCNGGPPPVVQLLCDIDNLSLTRTRLPTKSDYVSAWPLAKEQTKAQ